MCRHAFKWKMLQNFCTILNFGIENIDLIKWLFFSPPFLLHGSSCIKYRLSVLWKFEKSCLCNHVDLVLEPLLEGHHWSHFTFFYRYLNFIFLCVPFLAFDYILQPYPFCPSFKIHWHIVVYNILLFKNFSCLVILFSLYISSICIYFFLLGQSCQVFLHFVFSSKQLLFHSLFLSFS